MEWTEVKSFLEKPLLDFKDFEVSVFDLFWVVLIFLFVGLLLRSVRLFLTRRVFKGEAHTRGRESAVLQLIKYTAYLLAIVLSLETVGIDVSLVLVGSAGLLLGLGIGIQQTLNDLVCGLILLFEGSIRVGDVIEIDEVVGTVQAIGIRTSKVETREAISYIVPNSRFVTDKVINWSHNQKPTRFMVSIGVAYGSEVELVRRLLLETVRAHPEVLTDPRPFVRFVAFGDSSLDFELFFWSEQIWLIENIRSDLRFSIDHAFRTHNVTIPFPQRDLHLKSGLEAFRPSASTGGQENAHS